MKQEVTQLGIILAALQFAGEVCCAQSTDELFPRGSLFPCAAYSVGKRPRLAGQCRPSTISTKWFQPAWAAIRAQQNSLAGRQSSRFARDLHRWRRRGFPEGKGTPKADRRTGGRCCCQVSKVTSDRTIAWWYLAQEELRTWRRDEMLYLERITEAICKVDPLRRPILMYNAGHRSSAEIALTGRYLYFAAKGSYVNYSGNVDRRAWLAASIQQEVEAARQAPRKLTPLLIPEMFQNAPAGRSGQTGRWVRHDVVRGLIEGASGLLIVFFVRRNNFEDYETYFSADRTITPILCGAGELGQALLLGENIPAAMVDLSNGPKDLSIEAFGKTTWVPAVGLRATLGHACRQGAFAKIGPRANEG